jgi:release factor glutamine methyltransferase
MRLLFLTASAELTQRLIAEAAAVLAGAGIETSRLEAETMLAEAAGGTRAALVAGLAPIDATARVRYASMVKRRAKREPLAYILGRREFYSLEFEVSPAVLVPRPETEGLVDAALEAVGSRQNVRVLDIGTGSGAIALAVAANASQAEVVATDNSSAALRVAERNMMRLGVAGRVQLRLADCFEARDGGDPFGRFDIVVSNPPYVPDSEFDQLEPEIRLYEPRCALEGGADGLAFYRRMAAGLNSHLRRDGVAILEIGANQSAAVTDILRRNGAVSVIVATDLAGLPRVVIAHFE